MCAIVMLYMFSRDYKQLDMHLKSELSDKTMQEKKEKLLCVNGIEKSDHLISSIGKNTK